MTELLGFIAASFACYRLAQLVALDDGPFLWCAKLRSWAGKCAAAEQARDVQNGPCQSLAGLLNCPYCLGVWFALPLALLVAWDAASFIVLWPGIAGVQAFLQTIAGDDEVEE